MLQQPDLLPGLAPGDGIGRTFHRRHGLDVRGKPVQHAPAHRPPVRASQVGVQRVPLRVREHGAHVAERVWTNKPLVRPRPLCYVPARLTGGWFIPRDCRAAVAE